MFFSVSIDVDLALIYLLTTTVFFLLLYTCFDVNYFITNLLIIIWCKVRKHRIDIDQATEYYGICTTNDLDAYFQHINNARYTRELDFVRFHFFIRTGFYTELMKSKGVILQKASNIRYRRPIKLLSFYKVTSKIIYWDDKHIYSEHQFITLKDGFITTVILSKQVVLGVNVMEMMNKLSKKGDDFRPDPPPELEDWLKLNEKSSTKLRQQIWN